MVGNGELGGVAVGTAPGIPPAPPSSSSTLSLPLPFSPFPKNCLRPACDGEAIRARRMVIRAPQTVGCCHDRGIMSTIDCSVCVRTILEEEDEEDEEDEEEDAFDGVDDALARASRCNSLALLLLLLLPGRLGVRPGVASGVSSAWARCERYADVAWETW